MKGLEALKQMSAYHLEMGVAIRDLPNYEIIETALKEYEKQDNIISIIKETIEFNTQEPEMEVKENGEISLVNRVEMSLRKQLKEKERELLREWVLKTCFPKELKALEIIKRDPSATIETLNMYEEWEDYKEDCDDNCCSTFPFNNKEEFDLVKEVLMND